MCFLYFYLFFEANARCSHYLSRFVGYRPTKFPPDYDHKYLGPTHPITRILRVHAVETDPKFPRILSIHRVQISKISPDWEEYNSVGPLSLAQECVKKYYYKRSVVRDRKVKIEYSTHAQLRASVLVLLGT